MRLREIRVCPASSSSIAGSNGSCRCEFFGSYGTEHQELLHGRSLGRGWVSGYGCSLIPLCRWLYIQKDMLKTSCSYKAALPADECMCKRPAPKARNHSHEHKAVRILEK